MKRRRIFLLSPANFRGKRARLMLDDGGSALAQQIRREGAPLGEVFSFVSSLYFRGKLAYAQAFGRPPKGAPGAAVIAPGRGLLPPENVVTLKELRDMADVPVDAADVRYRAPLERDARLLANVAGSACDIILLGSVATPKYLEPLLDVFRERLLFPAEFVGRGDMSRGGLMLRCAQAGVELTYIPALGAILHGPRPPRLPKIARNPSW